MRWTLVLALAACLLAGVTHTTAAQSQWRYAGTDAACMQLMRANHLAVGSAKADWLGNYHGCDEVYNGDGRLLGYGRGTSPCERMAYRLAIRQGLYGEALHTRMGGKCVLYEDWSWGAE